MRITAGRPDCAGELPRNATRRPSASAAEAPSRDAKTRAWTPIDASTPPLRRSRYSAPQPGTGRYNGRPVTSLTTGIRGSGMFVPEGVVTNDRMSRLMDTSDEWIRQRTGIIERRYARRGTSSCDLGVEAARRALADAELEAAEVDLVIFATMTPAHYFPGNGGLLAARLGLTSTYALDIRMQCAGFLSGLHVADAFIRSGT